MHTRYTHHGTTTTDRPGAKRHPRSSPSPSSSSSSNDVANTWCHELSSTVATICDPLATIHWIPETTPIVASSSSVCRIVSCIDPHRQESRTKLFPFFSLSLAYIVCHFEDTILQQRESSNWRELPLDIDVTMGRKTIRGRFALEMTFLIIIYFLILIVTYSRRFTIIPKDRGFNPPARWTVRACRAPRCHWMLPANFRARTNVPRPIPTLATSLPAGRALPIPRRVHMQTHPPVCRHPCFVQAR